VIILTCKTQLNMREILKQRIWRIAISKVFKCVGYCFIVIFSFVVDR